jgi:hypothetical protein
MTPDRKNQILLMLEASREEVLAAAQSFSEEQAQARTDPGRWSALECLEHIGMVEERLRERLASAELVAEVMEEERVDAEKEAKLAAMVLNRSIRASAPEPVAPKGRFTSLQEAVDHFHAQRKLTILFVEERGGDLHRLTADHPRFGRLNGAEMIEIIAGHGRRHAEQIREIAAVLREHSRAVSK